MCPPTCLYFADDRCGRGYFDRSCVTMDTLVNARHAEISPALRAATEKKVAHLERFASDVRLVEVEFSDMASRRSADAHTCEILIHLKRQLVKGVASAAEQPVALDLAIEKVTYQMRRLHERRSVGRHGGPHRDSVRAAVRSAAGADISDLDGLAPAIDEAIDDGLLIVRKKQIETKTMDTDEAALQMELLGH